MILLIAEPIGRSYFTAMLTKLSLTEILMIWRVTIAPLTLALAPLRNREMAALLPMGMRLIMVEWPMTGTFLLLFLYQLRCRQRRIRKHGRAGAVREWPSGILQIAMVSVLFAWAEAPRLLFYAALLPTVLDLAEETASMLTRPWRTLPERQEPLDLPALGVFA